MDFLKAAAAAAAAAALAWFCSACWCWSCWIWSLICICNFFLLASTMSSAFPMSTGWGWCGWVGGKVSPRGTADIMDVVWSHSYTITRLITMSSKVSVSLPPLSFADWMRECRWRESFQNSFFLVWPQTDWCESAAATTFRQQQLPPARRRMRRRKRRTRGLAAQIAHGSRGWQKRRKKKFAQYSAATQL